MFRFIQHFRNFLIRIHLHKVFAYLDSNPLLLLLLFGLAGILGLYWSLDWLIDTKPFQIRLFFDYADLSVYFQSSRWAVGEGTLYKEVFSEYPFLANVVFGFFRFLAKALHPFPSSFKSFCWLWMSAAWLIYLWILYLVGTKLSKQALWIWLAPAPIYFTLFRFDIYPAVITLLALLAIRREKYFQGALGLGIAIALKGYALFVLPAYFVYLYSRKGFSTACKITVVCLAPWLFSNLVVFAFAGLEGLLKPYSFHIDRSLNKESSYDAILYLLRLEFLRNILDFSRIAQCLEIGIALFAAYLQPKRFKDLIDAFLLAIVGFMSVSTFYSPQFVLWSAPIACFSRSCWIKLFSITFSWVTFLYFPVIFDTTQGDELSRVRQLVFQLVIILVTANRFAIIYGSFLRLWSHRFKQHEALS